MFETFMGMRVAPSPVHIPPTPVLQISPDFPYCSDKFRAEWNAWALERFGVEETVLVFDAKALQLAGLSGGPMLVMNPHMIGRLKIAADAHVMNPGPLT